MATFRRPADPYPGLSGHQQEARFVTDQLMAIPEFAAERQRRHGQIMDATGGKGTGPGTYDHGDAALLAIAQKHGIELPHDYRFNWGANADELLKRDSFVRRNPWFMPAIAAGVGGFGAASGIAAAGGGAGGAGAVAPQAATPALSSLPVTSSLTVPNVGSVLGPAAAKGGAMAGFGKFLGSPMGMTLLGGGLDLLGGLIGGDDEQSSGRDDLIRSFLNMKDDDPRAGLVKPQNALFNALQAVIAMQKDVAQRPFIQPRPISAAPKPFQTGGLPFDIGQSTPQGPVSRTYQPPANTNIQQLLSILQPQPGQGPRGPVGGPSPATKRKSPFSRG